MNIIGKNYNNGHILIIGSGIIGKFNAAELSQLGFKITIVDPDESGNGSSASLGILMGKIYKKRQGRSWKLREKTIELWPKWINLLKQYNPNINIEKPLVQLTTKTKTFEKMQEFITSHPFENIYLLNSESEILRNVQNIFSNTKLQGIISHSDGRINPQVLLKTLDIYLKQQKIKIIKKKITKIERKKDNWIAYYKNGEKISPNAIIICNSLKTLELIDSEQYQIKLRPVLGQAFELFYDNDSVDFLSLPKVFSIDGKNFIPVNKNKIIVGSTDEYNIEANEEYIDNFIYTLDNKPNWLNKKNISLKWSGIRAMPINEPSPILKTLEKGLILCTGFYKNGILLAPACSNWIKNEIINNL